MRVFFSFFKCLFFVGGFFLSTDSFSRELQDSHIKIAHRAIHALHATDSYDVILPKIAFSLKYELIQQWPDKHILISQIVNQKAFEFSQRRVELEKEVASIYAHAFSEVDLRNIYDFYASETGKKLLKKNPLIIQEILDSVNIWKNGIARDLNDSVQRELIEIK